MIAKLASSTATKKKIEADSYSWKMKAIAGLIPKIITEEAVQEEEPILGQNHKCLAVIEGQGHITDPGQYVVKLANYFMACGGQIIKAAVTDLKKIVKEKYQVFRLIGVVTHVI